MHAATATKPDSDLGFAINNDGDLVCTMPYGSQMNSHCGMVRDSNNDITFSGTPTVGFIFQSSGDLQFVAGPPQIPVPPIP